MIQGIVSKGLDSLQATDPSLKSWFHSYQRLEQEQRKLFIKFLDDRKQAATDVTHG